MKFIPWIMIIPILLYACSISPQINSSSVNPTQAVGLTTQTSKPTDTPVPLPTDTLILTPTATNTVSPTETPAPTPDLRATQKVIERANLEQTWSEMLKNTLQEANIVLRGPDQNVTISGKHGTMELSKKILGFLGYVNYGTDQVWSNVPEYGFLTILGYGIAAMQALGKTDGTKAKQLLSNRSSNLSPRVFFVLSQLIGEQNEIELKRADGTAISGSVNTIRLHLITEAEFRKVREAAEASLSANPQIPIVIVDKSYFKHATAQAIMYFQNNELHVIYYSLLSPRMTPTALQNLTSENLGSGFIYHSTIDSLGEATGLMLMAVLGYNKDQDNQFGYWPLDSSMFCSGKPYHVNCGPLEKEIFRYYPPSK